MEKYAYRMKLYPGQEEEYRRRHDEIWPEVEELLKASGVSDYSIHLDRETGFLFGVLWLREGHGMADWPSNPVMRRWWDYMADIMETAPDSTPIAVKLETVFHLR